MEIRYSKGTNENRTKITGRENCRSTTTLNLIIYHKHANYIDSYKEYTDINAFIKL